MRRITTTLLMAGTHTDRRGSPEKTRKKWKQEQYI